MASTKVEIKNYLVANKFKDMEKLVECQFH